MQVSSISNQVRFKGVDEIGEIKVADSAKIDVDKVGASIDQFEKIAQKVNSDVSPITVISAVVAACAAAKSVQKIMPYIRKGAVTAGEYIAKGSVSLASGVKKLFTKKSINKEGAFSGITNLANKMRNLGGQENTKMMNGIDGFVRKNFGDDLADKITGFMRGQKLTSGTALTDAALALGAGAMIMDPVSDGVEGTVDGHKLARAASELICETV